MILTLLKPIASLLSGVGKQKKIFILIFHRVLDESDYMRPGEVDKVKFTWQMKLLKQYFNVLPLSEALEKIKNRQLPSRAVCITFDDGYADNYLNALPILNKYNLHATFFIASGYLNGGIMWNDQIIEAVRSMKLETLDLTSIGLGSYDVSTNLNKANTAQQIINEIKHLEYELRLEKTAAIVAKLDSPLPSTLMMTDEQLSNLHQAGMEIGGHTVSHPIMAKLDVQSLDYELKENKVTLEQRLNTKIRFFAYPNGKPEIDYKIEQIQQVKNVGYKAAVSTQWGVVENTSDYFQLPRFTPWDNQPIKFMLRMLIMYYRRGNEANL